MTSEASRLMRSVDLADAAWRKSARSSATESNCVEVAWVVVGVEETCRD